MQLTMMKSICSFQLNPNQKSIITSICIIFIKSVLITLTIPIELIIFFISSTIQSMIDELKNREHQLIESINHEEQARLKQLETLQQDVIMSSSLLSSLISQSQRLKQTTDGLVVMKQMKEYHQVEEKMKESVKRANQEMAEVEKMDMKNQELMMEKKALDAMVEEMKKMMRSMVIVREMPVDSMEIMQMEVMIDFDLD